MRTRNHRQALREGDLLAVVPVEGTYDESWSPRLSLADARKLEAVRLALRRGDIPAAARHGRVFAMKLIADCPLPEEEGGPEGAG
jgi:hypothetical protein